MTVLSSRPLKDIKFKLINKLFYYIKVDDKQYLYIFNILENEIFCLIYNNWNHPGYHWIYKHIIKALYIYKLNRWLYKYIKLYLIYLLI